MSSLDSEKQGSPGKRALCVQGEGTVLRSKQCRAVKGGKRTWKMGINRTWNK